MTLETFFGNSPSLWIAVAVVAGVLTIFFYSLIRVAGRADRDSERIHRRINSHHFDSSVIAFEAHQGRFARGRKGLDAGEGRPPQDAA